MASPASKRKQRSDKGKPRPYGKRRGPAVPQPCELCRVPVIFRVKCLACEIRMCVPCCRNGRTGTKARAPLVRWALCRTCSRGAAQHDQDAWVIEAWDGEPALTIAKGVDVDGQPVFQVAVSPLFVCPAATAVNADPDAAVRAVLESLRPLAEAHPRTFERFAHADAKRFPVTKAGKMLDPSRRAPGSGSEPVWVHRRANPRRCVGCSYVLPDAVKAEDAIPKAEDETHWKLIAPAHDPDCQWVLSRGFTRFIWCSRCNKHLAEKDAEHCSACPKRLCTNCWESFGQCDHKEKTTEASK